MSDTESIFDLENASTDTLLMLSADTLSLISGSKGGTFPIWYELHRLIESHIDKRIATESQKEECKQ